MTHTHYSHTHKNRYGSRAQVVARNMSSPEKTSLIGGHVGNVNVVRAAPNNTWAASADDAGKIRVWALQRDDHTCKIEKSTIAANDLKWDGDSKRIAAGGAGGRNKVIAFTWDTASELGKMGNHTKTVNSVDMRPTRPFRIVSGGEDFKVNMYKGPPFQFESGEKLKNFVSTVRYSPDASKVAAVTSGSQIILFDGKTHDVLKKNIGDQKGAILDCVWSKDGKSVVTASSNGTIHVTDVESGKTLNQVSLGSQKHQMVQGLIHLNDELLGITQGGDLLNFGKTLSKGPQSSECGHQSSITAMFVTADGIVYTGDTDGIVVSWTNGKGSRCGSYDVSKDDSRKRHTGTVVGLAVANGTLVTVGSGDQNVRISDLKDPSKITHSSHLGGTPLALVSNGDICVCTTKNADLVVIQKGAVTGTSKLKTAPTQGLAISPDGTEVCVAAARGHVVHRYKIKSDSSVEHVGDLHPEEKVLAIAYSPDGKYIATGANDGEIRVFTAADGKCVVERYWLTHKSKISSLSWDPSSKFLVSGSLDRNVAIHFIEDKRTKIVQKLAHYYSVNVVQMTGANTFVSAGADNAVQWWNITAGKTSSSKKTAASSSSKGPAGNETDDDAW